MLGIFSTVLLRTATNDAAISYRFFLSFILSRGFNRGEWLRMLNRDKQIYSLKDFTD